MRLPEEQIKKAILYVFTDEGSAVVKFGKKITLAHLGDESLMVTATVEE